MSKQTLNIPFSILDLATVVAEGSTPEHAFRNSLKLAQQAEQNGCRRKALIKQSPSCTVVGFNV